MIATETPDPREARAAAEARTLVDLLLVQAQLRPNQVAAMQKIGGHWKEFTWSTLLAQAGRLSEGLVRLGIEPGDRVCIFADTSLEWCLADFAIMAARAVPVPIYGSDTPEGIVHIVNDCQAKAVFFDHDRPVGKTTGRWTRLSSVASRCPSLEHFIGFETVSDPAEKLLSASELEAMGSAGDLRSIQERARLIGPEDLNCIIYTSGTTGAPKGVMLTHANWTFQARAIAEAGVLASEDVVLLFLPLAHSFARVVEAGWLGQGFALAFAESVEKAIANAAEVQATVIPAVPRVFEKAFAKVTSDGAAQPGVKGRLFSWAMREFEAYATARADGRLAATPGWTVARKLVFAKVAQKLKERFGGKVRLFISGGAPLSKKIALFFEVCGLTILEGYGLTETSAPTHVNRPGRIRLGTVGQPFPRTEVRIAPDGEILLRGPQVMKGYWERPKETAEILDPDGWLHTGDIGEVDGDGYLRITDRKKDLIKTSGGKYVAPQDLENALKTEPLVGQVTVIGDERRFVTALFTISEENAEKLAKQLNLSSLSYPEIARHPLVRKRLQAAVDALNSRLPSYATIKKFTILDQDWTQQSGELTPKLNVKRKIVAERYKPIIDAMYEDEPTRH